MTTNKTNDRVHLHIDNDSSLGIVFQVTPERLEAALKRHPQVAQKIRVTFENDNNNFEQHMATAEALMGWDIDVNRLCQQAPNLGWIHSTGAGVEQFAPFDWLPDHVAFTNNCGVHGDRANEYAIMAILMLNNRVPEMVTHQREGHWTQTFNTGIAGKTLLVVGVGHIGGGAAMWAKRFGMKVMGVRRTGEVHEFVDEMYQPEDLRQVIPKADYIILSVPNTPNTRQLIGKEEIDLIKTGGGLVNFTRAQVVDYDALRDRLERQEISAILDNFDPEPLPDESPLWNTPNLVITPHCSSDDSEVYIPRTLDLLLENMALYLDGKPLKNRVDPEQGY